MSAVPGSTTRRIFSGILPGIATQLFHARDEGRAVDAHAGCGPVAAADAAFAFAESVDDFFTLLLGVFV